MCMKKESLTIAIVQLTSSHNVEENLKKISYYLDLASKQKIDLLSFPENCFFMHSQLEGNRFQESLSSHYISHLQKIAKEKRITLHIGSFPEKKLFSKKHYQSSFLIHADGRIGPVYRKIHLFTLCDKAGEQHDEATYSARGKSVVIDEVAGWKVGLSICYDLRFPELYRKMSKQDLDLILVPSAFVAKTGKAHWKPLLQARAIENQVYVAASAQWGVHNPRRTTHGHSMCVDPWGEVIAEVSEGEGMIVCALTQTRLKEIRTTLPALGGRRLG